MIPLVRLLVLAHLASSPLCADTFGWGGSQFGIDFVEIRDAGNAADDTGYGAVRYDYRIAKYEVSREIVESYNSLTDGVELGLIDMSTFDGNGPSRPATGPNWNRIAHFVNWLNTSKGYSPAYKFSPSARGDDDISLWTEGEPGYDPDNPFRNRGARYFLPSEDEWYKAAYFDSGANGGAGGYWDYATGSDIAPTGVASGTTSGTMVYLQSNLQGPADITNAGGLSSYGTMGQNGNVWEWCESGFESPNDAIGEDRVYRGGVWDGRASDMRSSNRRSIPRTQGSYVVGFRVASFFDADGDGLRDSLETNTGVFIDATNTGTDPNKSDTDEDGLSDYAEVEIHGTNPVKADTDNDGFHDRFELNTGYNPTSDQSVPDAHVDIRTAIEVNFNAVLGATYAIEFSQDSENWSVVEDNIQGAGEAVERLYSIKDYPRGFFRVERTDE